MDEWTRKILTDEKLISYHKSWFKKMQDLFEGSDTDPFFLGGVLGRAKEPELLYTDPEVWMEQVLENLAERAAAMNLADREKRFIPLCVEGGIYGVHFVDKILGAEVFFQDGQWYNRYLQNEVGQLQKPNLDKDETWNLAKRIANAFLESGVTVPLFGLPTIASALNIAVNLYGEEILVAMLMEPEAARHDLQIINEVLMELHGWYLKHIPMNQLQPVIAWERTQPPGYGQLCGCTTQLLSPELYEEFIMPLDNALLGVYPYGGMIHLCGSNTQLLPLFAKMKNLKSVQLNDRAAEQLECYVKELRDDQVIYLNPCEGMPKERALETAAGRKMVMISYE